MNRRVTNEEYARRVARVTAALHERLDEGLSLDKAAALACFSPFHFHRIYRAVAGETLDETRRRLLLHRAAGELAASGETIDSIARRAGYGSAAAFTRAFARDYGQPPAAFRERVGSAPRARANALQEAPMFKVEITHQDAMRIVGLPHVGDYQTIGATFERLGALAYGWRFAPPFGFMVGVYYDDPESVPANRLRAFAGLAAPDDFDAPEGIQSVRIEAGPIASIVFKGPYAELPKAYADLFRRWLPASGREPADAPCFEIYLNDPRSVPPSEWLTRVCLPLKA